MIEGQEGVTWDEWVALARACEEAGIGTLLRSDHYLGTGRVDRDGALDAWATIAALAAATDRLRLGTLVSPVTFRPAAVLAKNAITADHVSGGRIDVGVGAGWFEPEHELYGLPFRTARERVALLAEQLETIVRQWTEDEFLPPPVQQPHPPLIVGGTAKPGTVGPAVRWANEYNTHSADPEECARRRRVLDDACREAGRDPETLPLSLMRTCVVGSDEHDLRERLGRFVDVTTTHESVDDLVRARRPEHLIGTVEEVAERLRRYEAAGVTRVMCQHLVHEDLDMVETLGRELAPAVS